MKSTTIKSLALAAALALTLTACGGSDDPAPAGGGGGETGAADGGGGGGLVGTGTGDECVIEDAVPVGAALSLTGAAGSYGESQKRGLELAAEDLAKKGGVTYDLKIEDDQTDSKQGITVFEAFTKDRSVIIGPTLSNTAFQAQPIAQEAACRCSRSPTLRPDHRAGRLHLP